MTRQKHRRADQLLRFAEPAADQRRIHCACGQQARYQELMGYPGQLQSLLRKGAEKARSVASVTLDEGVNVIANVVNCAAGELKVGMRVKPYWHPLPNGMHLPMFEPDEPAS